MTAGQPAQGVVKVRWARGIFTSPLMSMDAANLMADALHLAVVDCGDSPRFIEFAGRHGLPIRLRGRDVVSVEAAPDLGERTPHRLAGGFEHGEYSPPATGTDFLRQQASYRNSLAEQRDGARP